MKHVTDWFNRLLNLDGLQKAIDEDMKELEADFEKNVPPGATVHRTESVTEEKIGGVTTKVTRIKKTYTVTRF